MDEEQGTLFRSVNHAMAFAFNFTHGTLKRSNMAKMMGGPTPTGRGLAGLDGAGQAGMIKQVVDSLPELYRHVLVARFAPRTDPCECKAPCCQGWRPAEVWGSSIYWLAQHILTEGLTGNVGHYGFRRAVVGRYFGEKVSFLTIAAEAGVHRNTASALNAAVVDYFQGNRAKAGPGVEWRARNEMEQRLHAAGVIE